MGFFMDQIAAAAVSFTIAGNTGISSFLTLFLVGCIERYDSSLLNMDERMETMLASWPALILLAILTALEFVAMCVPVVDEITDTALTFIVPIVSTIGTLSTFGLYDRFKESSNSEEYYDDEGRRLNAGDTAMVAFQCIMVICGICLALTMHFFKMLIRLIGEGWLTNILTILESSWCVTTVLMAVFIRAIAIFVAVILLTAASWLWWRRCQRQQEQQHARGLEQAPSEEERNDKESARYHEMP